MSDPVWRPSAAAIERARLTAFQRWLAAERGLPFADYAALWQWSVTDLEGFWSAWCDWIALPSSPRSSVLALAAMPGAQWFAGVELNYVEQVFRHGRDTSPAIIAGEEGGRRRELSWGELRRQVAALAATLRRLGVESGDRIAAYLPNIPEAVVAFLAAASIGAIWSVCAPDMGVDAVLDRFRQISPKVIIAADGYRYGGKSYPRLDVLRDLLAGLPSVQHVVLVPHFDPQLESESLGGALSWASAIAGTAALKTQRVAFEHPLWIVYSSGTTGLPKPIVHSQGGVVRAHQAGRNPSRSRPRGAIPVVFEHRLDDVERAGGRTAGRQHDLSL